MSDITPETVQTQAQAAPNTAPPPPDPPAPEVATDQTDPLEPRVADLESRVAALEAGVTKWQDVSNATPADAVRPADAPFDTQARLEELLAQGVPERDAVEQAAYEERLHNDQQAGA